MYDSAVYCKSTWKKKEWDGSLLVSEIDLLVSSWRDSIIRWRGTWYAMEFSIKRREQRNPKSSNKESKGWNEYDDMARSSITRSITKRPTSTTEKCGIPVCEFPNILYGRFCVIWIRRQIKCLSTQEILAKLIFGDIDCRKMLYHSLSPILQLSIFNYGLFHVKPIGKYQDPFSLPLLLEEGNLILRVSQDT